MLIKLNSVMVDDQEKALKFYTEKLGFVKKADVSNNGYRWLTVCSPHGPDGVELLLEQVEFPQAKEYQKALYDMGRPITILQTENFDEEYQQLKARGVIFRGAPQKTGIFSAVLFEDTCGNLINLVQVAN